MNEETASSETAVGVNSLASDRKPVIRALPTASSATSSAASVESGAAKLTRVSRRGGRSLVALRKTNRRLAPADLGNHAGDHRQMLADYCKLLAWWLGRPPVPTLPPRLDLALRYLLRGKSEKEMAREMKVSPFTAHEYVKQIHARLGVTSRGELLARFLPTGQRSPE